MPNPTRVPITQPRVPFLNPETGFVSQPWYLFLLSLNQLTSGSEVSLGDVQKGPPSLTVDEINAIIDKAAGDITPSQDGLLAQIAELQKQVNALALQPIPDAVVAPAPTWINLVSRPSVTAGTSTVDGIPGDVRLHAKVGQPDVYRFIPSNSDPLIDSFYASFSGSVLSDLIVSRG